MKPEDQMPADEMISAWLDGTLDDEGARRMTELAARDEAFARRVERLHHIDNLVRAAVPAETAIPAALLERLGLAPDPVNAASVYEMRSAGVVDLAAVRQERAGRNSAPAPMVRARGGFFRMAAQLALVAGVGLAVVVVSRPGDRADVSGADYSGADYRALGSAPDAAAHEANALLRFAPGVAASEAGKIASAAHVQLLGAPNAAGAWKAFVAPGRRAAVLAALRSEPRVIMAEPIDGAPQ
ncbi:hypothetical protein [Novosphingobium sp. PASSN1]|uniref:anti-sigma factor family protein n=1 Tax=Novosphingobium sp. PASSN1 TaxID=2015561 RepID=UPI000BC37D83|nr:hypothetical protein [Novosphingobium sp. PASSN1]OYU35453.1 MAG: hypothetical protein CFE35_10810 [Novosphingobium sp. PASSN1]